MRTVEIIGLEGDTLHYCVKEGDVVIAEKRQPIKPLLKATSEKGVSVRSYLRHVENADSVRTPKPPAPEEPIDDSEEPEDEVEEPTPELPLATDHRHEDVLVLKQKEHVHDYAEKGHSHTWPTPPPQPEHEHPFAPAIHTHDLVSHQHDYAPRDHKHEVPDVSNVLRKVDDLRVQINKVQGQSAEAGHVHPYQVHEHEPHKHDDMRVEMIALAEAVVELRARVKELEARPAVPQHDHAHSHPMPEHSHSLPDHEHLEYEKRPGPSKVKQHLGDDTVGLTAYQKRKGGS